MTNTTAPRPLVHSSPATCPLPDDDRPAHLAHVAHLLDACGSFTDVHVRGGRVLFRGDRLDAAELDAFAARHALDLVHHTDRLHSLV